MKIEYNNKRYILYMNLFYEKKICFKEKEELEKYFRKLFQKLNTYYDMEFSGYYDIHVYDNAIYGAIITIEKEEYEYYDYFEDKLDMRISVSEESPFLYQLEDFDIAHKIAYPIYQYRNQFYLELEKPLDSIQMGKLLEHSTVLYDKEAETILRYGKKIKREEG